MFPDEEELDLDCVAVVELNVMEKPYEETDCGDVLHLGVTQSAHSMKPLHQV